MRYALILCRLRGPPTRSNLAGAPQTGRGRSVAWRTLNWSDVAGAPLRAPSCFVLHEFGSVLLRSATMWCSFSSERTHSLENEFIL